MRRPALVLALLLAVACLVLAIARFGLIVPNETGAKDVADGADPTAPHVVESAAPVPNALEPVERARAVDGVLPPLDAPADDAHAIVEGVVREDGAQRTIPGAHVWLLPADNDRSGMKTTTADPDGRFRFVVEKGPRQLALSAQAPGFARATVELEGISTARVTQDFTLQPNRSVIGRVLDRQGAPAAGVLVLLECVEVSDPQSIDLDGLSAPPSSNFAEWKDARTDGEGRFRIVDVPAQALFRLQVRAGARGIALREAGIESRAVREFDFGDVVLGEPYTLSGTVVRAWKGEPESTSEPLAGIVVELRKELLGDYVARNGIDADSAPRRVLTAGDGSFSFGGLLPSRYRVVACVDAEGAPLEGVGVDGTGELTDAERRPGTMCWLGTEGKAAARIVVARTRKLRGLVLDAELHPAAGAEVEAIALGVRGSARTDERGRFEIAGLGRKPMLLRVRPAQSTTGVLPETTLENVLPGANEVQVVLAAAAFVAGRVVDADGRPVAFAGVTAKSSSGAELDFAYTDEDGRFRLRVAPGEAIDLEACPSRTKENNVRGLDTASPLRARARGVRSGANDVVLRMGPR